jgi:hypothetical protein
LWLGVTDVALVSAGVMVAFTAVGAVGVAVV